MNAGVDSEELRIRRALGKCRSLVVKIGSKALAHGGAGMFERLAADIASVLGGGTRQKRQRRVVLVSSGAIAFGIERLGLKSRPRTMAGLQAAAATGQSLLMQRYGDAFAAHGIVVAQVLLSHADLASRLRANNARAALHKLLDMGVLPIINENDAVAVDEIRFGDNDELAAMVAPLCEAELLLLLSNVDGLLDASSRRISFAPRVDETLRSVATAETSGLGRGGMQSKLEAARLATLAGAHVVIASGAEERAVERVLAGEELGTVFPRMLERLATRKHWIAFTLRPRGAAIVDAGAADAIQNQGRSVLCVGVLGVRGTFVRGDPISILTTDGREIARGLARLSASDAARLCTIPKPESSEPLVHRDDLVVLPA
jgi:glutamate 5-kinase